MKVLFICIMLNTFALASEFPNFKLPNQDSEEKKIAFLFPQCEKSCHCSSTDSPETSCSISCGQGWDNEAYCNSTPSCDCYCRHNPSCK